jgi:hypothetical protein
VSRYAGSGPTLTGRSERSFDDRARSRTTTRRSDLGGVPAQPGTRDPGDRFLHRRDHLVPHAVKRIRRSRSGPSPPLENFCPNFCPSETISGDPTRPQMTCEQRRRSNMTQIGRAHNPEVTGSNPVPATRSTSANERAQFSGVFCIPPGIPQELTRWPPGSPGRIFPRISSKTSPPFSPDPKVAAAGHEIPLRDILCRLIVSNTRGGRRSDVRGWG